MWITVMKTYTLNAMFCFDHHRHALGRGASVDHHATGL